MQLAGAVVQLLLLSSFQVHALCEAVPTCKEDDAFPLLQLSRHNSSNSSGNSSVHALHETPAVWAWREARARKSHAPDPPVTTAPSPATTAPAAPLRANSSGTDDDDDSERTLVREQDVVQDAALPFFGPTALPETGTVDGKTITRRMREKQLGREAVSAAALIMLLITFSVGLQLIMVEFVMTGTCAIPQNIAEVVLAMIVTITVGLRTIVRFITSPLRPPARFLWSCCCAWRPSGKVPKPPVTTTLPDPIMQQVAGFLSLDGMCELSCASRACKESTDSDSCYEALMTEVVNAGLEHRWHRHAEKYKAEMTETESASSGTEGSSEVPKTEGEGEASETKSPKVPRHYIQELRRFLCKQLRRSKAKAEAREVNERWNVITDVVRYLMLVIGWFWFSAEVMNMACLEGGGPWQIGKAVSSPCLFIFLLESDRQHFWWQVLAGSIATVLLLDLLFS